MLYAYFDIETGEIDRVSNELTSDLNYLEIDRELYVQFATGEKNFINYRVIPSPKDHTAFEIIEKTVSSIEFDVDKSIHELEKVQKDIDDTDIFVIIQDVENNTWKAKAHLSDNYITFLSQTKDYYNKHKEVYVTEENNPNILLDVLKIPMENFLTADEFELEYADSSLIIRHDISLYCATIYEKYKHYIKG
jgi:hypothetical protein